MRTFVRRAGRTTLGQARAFEELGPQYLLPYTGAPLDFAAAFGTEIKWYGPRAKPDVKFALEPDLLKLADWADVLIVCARGDQTTEKIINAEIIKALGGDGTLINISRGNVIDEDALIAALKSGALGSAGLDVFVEEPTPIDRWKEVPNCTLTPHLGGGTREALWEGSQNVLENLRRFHAGEELLTPLAG